MLHVNDSMGLARARTVMSSTPSAGASTGAQAAAGWLSERGLSATTLKRWHVEVSIALDDTPAAPSFDDRVDTRFHIDLYSEEWGFFVCHQGRASWIRVTDIVFVHGRDDFGLLGRTPPLAQVGRLLADFEREHGISFRRGLANVRTNVPGSEPVIRRWVEAL